MNIKYNPERHREAIDAWWRGLVKPSELDGLPTYIARDFEMVKVIDFEIVEKNLEFRSCHGCGVEHLLRREHQLLYPDSDDPRPLCFNCEESFVQIREKAVTGTGRGTPLTDIREIAKLVLALKAAIKRSYGESNEIGEIGFSV